MQKELKQLDERLKKTGVFTGRVDSEKPSDEIVRLAKILRHHLDTFITWSETH